MVKLVCCDIDGTLIPYGEKDFRPGLFELIHELRKKGILFCPVSGRQYPGLKMIFAPIADECVIISENGAIAFQNDEILYTIPIPRITAEEIAWAMWEETDGEGEVLLSGAITSYIMNRGLGIADTFYGSKHKIVEIQDPSQIPEDILKVSVRMPDKAKDYAARFQGRWKDAEVVLAGLHWIDATTGNKGSGIRELCRILQISPEEVMAFGDFYNDVPMLDAVGHPYIMENTVSDLLERYPNHASTPEEVMRRVLLKQ